MEGVLGECSEIDLFAAAGADAQRLGESWFFVAQRRLMAGDRAGAAQAFQSCRKHADPLQPESTLAKAELRLLGE
jgi:hypothetical protein